MNGNYWNRALRTRLSRRRALAAAGSLAAGTAILSACGGGEGDGGGEQVSSLLYKGEDTSKTAKHGGTYRGFSGADPLNWDYYNFDAASQAIHPHTGVHLLRMKAGHLETPALVIENEAAEKYEYSPDKLTLTFKLNPKAKFSPQSSTGFHSGIPASVFNRQIDADDVVFSFDRLSKTVSATIGGRGELFNAVNKIAPVLSVNKIDASTVQLKLDHPSSALLTAIADAGVSYPHIIPKEGKDNAIDFLKTQVSGGPYYIEKFEPSVSIVMKRNPNYEALFPEDKLPYFDTIDLPRIVDPAQRLAQFRAGALFDGPLFGPIEDRLALKRELPELLMWTDPAAGPEKMWFGQHADSPFRDYRLRQAIYLTWDRNTHIKVTYSTDKLEAAGIPADIRWATFISCADTGPPGGRFRGEWLNPQSKEFGENAKYFTLGKTRADDLAEAKKLVKAATGKDVLEFDHYRVLFPGFPTQGFDVMDGVLSESGLFKTTQKPLNVPDYLAFRNTNPWGNWIGVLSTARYVPPDPVTYFFHYLHKDGGFFGGFSGEAGIGALANSEPSPDKKFTDGSPLRISKGDPAMTALIDKMYAEFDEKKRLELIHEAQRYAAKMVYYPDYPGGANSLFVSWPAVENRRAFRSGGLSNPYRHIWLNDQKAPLKRA
jgi:ABC-type transport system substrate-binding protein